MKLKMKTFLLIGLAITITSVVHAQNKTTFSVAANAGSGTSKYYKLSAGGDLQLDIPAGSALKFTASAGYENMAYEIPNGTGGFWKGHSGYVPVLAGLKLAFGKGLYGHGQLGYAINTHKNPGSVDNGNFAWAPSLGYGFGKNLDLAVKYMSFGPKAIVARLAYNF
ncbi:MAG TPA: hypothetical protein VMY77_11790 [Chitinophagaceae bacterium]|nr:hypothetical protein [Chitinophagaceae bacterium]